MFIVKTQHERKRKTTIDIETASETSRLQQCHARSFPHCMALFFVCLLCVMHTMSLTPPKSVLRLSFILHENSFSLTFCCVYRFGNIELVYSNQTWTQTKIIRTAAEYFIPNYNAFVHRSFSPIYNVLLFFIGSLSRFQFFSILNTSSRYILYYVRSPFILINEYLTHRR